MQKIPGITLRGTQVADADRVYYFSERVTAVNARNMKAIGRPDRPILSSGKQFLCAALNIIPWQRRETGSCTNFRNVGVKDLVKLAGADLEMRLLDFLPRRSSSAKTQLPGFDPIYYLYWYPDVRFSGYPPLEHYLQHGWKEGRDPSAGFSTLGYLAANPDVVQSGANPLLHYVNFGFAEGRSGH